MITPPKPLITVNPGDPLKSEDWNNIVSSLQHIYSVLNTTLGSISLLVENKGDGNAISDAVVTLIPDEAGKVRVQRAGYIGATERRYVAYELQPGKYKVTVEATGYDTEERNITIPSDGSVLKVKVEMSLTKATVAMINVFGLSLKEAVQKVTEAKLTISRIIDSHGKEIPPGKISDEQNSAVILNQVPEPDTVVPLTATVQLHIAAKAEFTEKVEIPNLSGLSLEEAKAKLAASRLVLGDTKNVKK